MNVQARILQEAQEDFKKFMSPLIPNIDNVLGVRLPVLRKLQKKFIKTANGKIL